MNVAKQDKIIEILDLMTAHGITIDDLNRAQGDAPHARTQVFTSKIMAYLGGIFVLAGIGLFISLLWPAMDVTMRIVMTYGIGICAFVSAVSLARLGKMGNAVTPLFLVSALLQITGLFIAIDHFSTGGDGRYAVLMVMAYMIIQSAFAFYALRVTSLAFIMASCGIAFSVTLVDLIGVPDDLSACMHGIALLLSAYGLERTPHRGITGILYFFGGIAFLGGTYELVKNSFAEVVFLGAAAGVLALSARVRSRILLTIATLAMLWYISHFTYTYFSDTLGWPVVLIVIGIAFFGLARLAQRVNAKYIKT